MRSNSKWFIAVTAAIFEALVAAPVNATPNCLKDHKAFNLAGDTIGYSMAIAPGADCIQGLRWSFMQIYKVWVLEKPKNGELEMVGPGFRYFARPNFSGTDKFSLVVVGKNRHEDGYSTVEFTVSRSNSPPPPGAMSRLGSEPTAKLADAAPGQ